MNTDGVHFVHWPGLACSAVGGMFWLLAYAKGRQKRELESATPVSRLSDLKSLAASAPLLVAVSGEAHAERHVSGELTNQPCVITEAREQLHMQKRTASNRWVRDTVTQRHVRKDVPWGIQDGSGTLPVIDAARAAHLALPLVVESFSAPDRGLVRTSIDLFAGVRMLGVSVTEHSLAVGTPLTCVGELSKAPSWGGVEYGKGVLSVGGGNMLVLKAPVTGDAFFITTQSLPELISSISGIARTCKWLAFGFGAVGAALVAWKLSGGVATLVERRKLRRRVLEANRRLEEARRAGGSDVEIAADAIAGGAGAGDRDDNLCAICLEQPAGAVFAACGHMCTCWECAQRMDRCPLCRSRTHAIKVYRP